MKSSYGHVPGGMSYCNLWRAVVWPLWTVEHGMQAAWWHCRQRARIALPTCLLLHFWPHLIHKAAGSGKHRLRVATADAQHNMLHPGVFVAFDGVDHVLRRATDGGGTPGGIATVAKGD